jgi:hypothetical protein
MTYPTTLSTAHHKVTLSGAIDAYGSVDVIGGVTYYAAVFGPAGAHFTVTNNADIDAQAFAHDADGIILASAGTIINKAIIAASFDGILVQSTTGTSLIRNEGTIQAGNIGIYLKSSGDIRNAGQVTAGLVGLYISGPGGYGENTGLINAQFGMNLAQSGTLNNQGTIDVSLNGLFMYHGGTFNNTGTIIAFGTYIGASGIVLSSGGQGVNAGHITGAFGIIADKYAAITNTSTGTITATGTAGLYAGVLLNTGGGYLLNYGSIAAPAASAVYSIGATTILNYGHITGYTDGVTVTNDTTNPSYIYNGGFLAANAKPITGTSATYYSAAAALAGPGSIVNTGTILDSFGIGILLTQGGTIFDDGTIIGGAYAIDFAAGAANRLVINAASRIIGAINGGNGILELAADPTQTGTISPQTQAQFTNFNSIQIDSGATWDFTGNLTVNTPAALRNNGTIKESAIDHFTIDSALTGTGKLDLSKNTLTLNNSVTGGEKIAFTGTAEILALGDPTAFHAKIENFKSGDTIDLTGITLSAITAMTFANSVLTLTEGAAKLDFTFANPGTFGTETFKLAADAQGTAITLAPGAKFTPIAPENTLTQIATFWT